MSLIEGRTASVAGCGRWTRTLALSLALLGLTTACFAADPIPLRPSELAIQSPDGSKIIGHCKYTFSRTAGGADVNGKAQYSNGEHDVERESLRWSSDDQQPELTTFVHSFYHDDGSLQQEGSADLKAGTGSCRRIVNGKEEKVTTPLNFPSDTYAGVSLVVPVMYALRHGIHSKIRFHAFSCMPDPKLVTVEANVRHANAHWNGHPGDLVEVEIKPYIRWIGFLASPFLPKYRAWFDPQNDFEYVGGRNQRYYKGPMVQLVLVAPGKNAPLATPAPESADEDQD